MTNYRHDKLRQRRLRRGSLYVAVMGVTIIVAMIGLCAMQLARLERRGATARQEMAEARLLARSGIEMAVNWINTNENWRTIVINDTESPNGTLGNGTFSWLLYDEDGDLTDDETDAVLLKGIGRVGDTVQVKSVLLAPAGAGLDCLKSAAHAGDDFELYTFGDVVNATGAPISSDTKLGNWGTVNANVESNGWVGPGSVNGTVTDPSPLKEIPGSAVFDYYLANGTTIDYNSLPVDIATGGKKISTVLLSPSSNPYGETNAQGIYIIDCQGQFIKINRGRIYGTLVLLNPGPNSNIGRELHWEPAVVNFPSLMVQGDISIEGNHDTQIADEASFGINLNPPGAPYDGVEDSDLADTYPVLIEGLVYVTGQVNLKNSVKFQGAVVAGGMIQTANVTTATFEHSTMFFNNPPPGFSGGSVMKISPGSWQRSTL